MTGSPINHAIQRHQTRRGQGVLTVTALVGPTGLGVRAWRAWVEAEQRPVAVAPADDAVAAWVEAAFSDTDPTEWACRWLAAVTRRDAAALTAVVGRMTRYDLELLWRSLPTDGHAPVARAAFLILADRTAGAAPDAVRFVRELAGGGAKPAEAVAAVAGLYPATRWPALLVLPAGDARDTLRLVEAVAAAEPRLPVGVALTREEYDRLVATHPDSRAAALAREGFVEVRGVSGNELGGRLRAAGVEPPAGAVARLAADGLAEDVADAFVGAARAVRAPTAADLASDFRSVHEEFLFGQLESMPATAGLFRPNRLLGFRHGPKPAEADLLAESLKLVVEVDGGFYHLAAEQFRRDRRKDWLYQRHGYLVLRFLAEDVVSDLELILNTILEAVALRRASAPPTGAA